MVFFNPGIKSNVKEGSFKEKSKSIEHSINLLKKFENTIKRDADGYRHACENLEMQNRQLYEKL